MGQTIGYARVSAKDQNPDLQLDALERAGCDKMFVEKASGALRERPQLTACLEYVRPGDVLVVWKLDRLGRSQRHIIDLVADLGERGIDFRSLKEHIDTTSAIGKFTFHLFAAMAELERDIIRERAAAGRAAAQARGETGGRPRKLTPDRLAAAKALLGTKRTVLQAAESVGVSPATLYRHLKAEGFALPSSDRGGCEEVSDTGFEMPDWLRLAPESVPSQK